jgi:hypothetical protein
MDESEVREQELWDRRMAREKAERERIAELEVDAARWRWWVSRTGAVNNELKFPTPDVNRHLVGVNLMRGSVAEHFAKAVDAAIAHASIDREVAK